MTCFVPFVVAAFVITQVVRHAMLMSSELQALGTTWKEAKCHQECWDTAKCQPSASGERAWDSPFINAERIKHDQGIFLLEFFFFFCKMIFPWHSSSLDRYDLDIKADESTVAITGMNILF